MKKTLLFLIIFLSLSIKAQDIQRLFDNRDFIRLSNLEVENWKPNDFFHSFVKVHTLNALARFEESNRGILPLLNANEARRNSDFMIALLILQADNYVKMFQYRQASEVYKKILNSYGDLLGEGKWSYENSARKYSALSNVRPLQVNIPQNTTIQMTPDRQGLLQVPVRTLKDSVLLIFDTGAGISMLTESVAKRLGISILADSIIMNGGIADMEYMKIGVADVLYLGDIAYKNVVFGIIEDEKAVFPGHYYTISGTLGFPEIRALSSMKIHRNGILEVFKNAEPQHKNNMMFTNMQQIIVQVNDSLLFWLDTGAVYSSLSVNYYNNNKRLIERIGKSMIRTVSGIGGSQEFYIYILTDFPIKINTTTAYLSKMHVFTLSAFILVNEYDGVLGQDIISRFNYILIDFKNMYFAFGDKHFF